MNKLSTLLLFLLFSHFSSGQKADVTWDTYIKNLPIYNSSNLDSLPHWSQKLRSSGNQRAIAFAERVDGFYFDYLGEKSKSLESFLTFAKAVQALNSPNDELIAISDLAYVYLTTNRHSEAKKVILSFLSKSLIDELEQKSLAVIYNNLGQCYRQENKIDSALISYNKSLDIKNSLGDSTGIANVKINLTSLYIQQGNYQQALIFSKENIAYFTDKIQSDLWYNVVNKAGALNGLGRKSEAKTELLNALKLANQLNSKSLIQQSHEQLAAIYNELGEYQEAYKEIILSNQLKSEILNKQTSNRIAELQEAYNAEEREKENQLLSARLQSQKNRQLALLVGIIAFASLAAIVGFSYHKNKKKNSLIQAQNKKLTQLNAEKNHLLSVVSHDLSSPFSAIKLWVQNLSKNDKGSLREVEEMISKTADFGLNAIRALLTFDKQEAHEVRLENTDLAELTASLIKRFEPLAKAKGINLKAQIEQDREHILTDKKMLFRALENLLSNAIKYSEDKTEVWYRTYEKDGYVHFEIRDEGKGISEVSQKYLFEKYSTAGNQPTGGEQSHGLGLYIVKRIAEELGAKLMVQSEEGKGSCFTFSLKAD